MSTRLKQLLEVTASTEPVLNHSPGRTTSSLVNFTRRESMRSLGLPDESVHPGVSLTNSVDARLEGREKLTAVAVSAKSQFPTNSQIPPPADSASESEFAGLSTGARDELQLFVESGESSGSRKQNRSEFTTLLEKKLRQYLELDQPSLKDRHGPVRPTTGESPSRSSVANTGTSFGPDRQATPWPEIVGREISRRAQGASSRLPFDVSNGVLRTSTDKVEIQNVFNIKVRNETNSLHGFDDLSEKIVEILNEQALQHGIEVT
jgi:hypothetical protein